MKVRVLPCQPLSLVFGGFEIQMLSVIQAVQDVGVDIAPLDVWSRNEKFEILHLWGLEDSHLLAANWAHRAGKRIVLTALLPYLTPKAFAKYFIGRVLGLKRNQLKILSMVDLLVVVNEEQARTASLLFGIESDRIAIIPNIVEDIYINRSKNKDININLDIDKYIICTGNICKRKNQLLLAQAAIEENIPLLIIGHSMPGEDAYANKLSQMIAKSKNVQWIKGLPAQSQQLLAAYDRSIGFALLSTDETQPISALEAAMLGKPLLLSEKSWAKQELYQNACLVNPFSLKHIKYGLKQIVNHTTKFGAPQHILEKCTRNNVGKSYAEAIKKLTKESSLD